MPTSRIGVAVSAPDANAIMANIDTASKAGVESVWLTTGGAGLDGLTIFAAATQRFENMVFGTSIVPTFVIFPSLNVVVPFISNPPPINIPLELI